MDKTIELILVATVVLVTGLGVMFIFTGKSSGFDNFLDNQSQNSQCGLLQTHFKNQGGCSCSNPASSSCPASSIYNEYNDRECSGTVDEKC